MASPPEKTEQRPPGQTEGGSAGSLALRLWDSTKRLITITDHLKILEKEDGRIQTQIHELSRIVLDVVKEVREISGQLKSIEKRLDDKDKMADAIIQVRVIEALARIPATGPAKPRPKKR